MARLKALPKPIILMRERIVVHHQTSPQAVEDLIDTVREMKDERDAGQRPERAGEGLREEERMIGTAKLRKQAALGY
jgi:threonine aldolase